MNNLGESTGREDVAVESSQSPPGDDLLYRVNSPGLFCLGDAVMVRDVARYVRKAQTYRMFHDTTIKNTDTETLEGSMNMYWQTEEPVSVRNRTLGEMSVRKRIIKRFRIVKMHHVKFMGVATIVRDRGKNIARAFRYNLKYTYCPSYITLGCDNQDDMGFCMGHKMSRKEFINTYCDGIEPPQLEDLWDETRRNK